MADAGFSIVTSLRYDVGLLQVPAKGLDYAGWNYARESPLYMLDQHRDRLVRAAAHWQWPQAVSVLSGDDAIERMATLAQRAVGSDPKQLPLRLRLLIDDRGTMTLERHDTAAVPLENLLPRRLPDPGASPGPDEPRVTSLLTLVVDSDATPRSEFTHFKTTRRAVYNAARRRAGILEAGEPKEVLVIDGRDGCVMEGSITTPYFWRDGRWVTPPVPAIFSPNAGSGGHDGASRRWALQRGLAVEQTVAVNSLVDGEQCWISNGVSGFRAAVLRLRHDT